MELHMISQFGKPMISTWFDSSSFCPGLMNGWAYVSSTYFDTAQFHGSFGSPNAIYSRWTQMWKWSLECNTDTCQIIVTNIVSGSSIWIDGTHSRMKATISANKYSSTPMIVRSCRWHRSRPPLPCETWSESQSSVCLGMLSTLWPDWLECVK